MAARTIVGRFAALSRASQDVRVAPRSFATAAAKFQEEENNVDTKRNAGHPVPSSSTLPRSRPSLGLFSEMIPPLGRGTSLLQMIDTMEDLFNSSSVSPLSPSAASRVLRSSNRTPWDVMEDAKAFRMRLDMPGLSKEDVKVDVVEGNLVVKGEHKGEDGEDDWSARSYSSYNIKIKLPDNVKAEAIKAELKNGVLRVMAPKMDDAKKRVEVHVE